MQILPRREPHESTSAYRFRYARFSLRWLAALGLPLLLLLAFSPNVAQSSTHLLLMFAYFALPIGSAIALVSALRFSIWWVVGALPRAVRPCRSAVAACEVHLACALVAPICRVRPLFLRKRSCPRGSASLFQTKAANLAQPRPVLLLVQRCRLGCHGHRAAGGHLSQTPEPL